MARTKRKSVASKHVKSRVRKTSEIEPLFKWGESYTSVVLGFVVFVIAALFIGSLIKVRHIQETSSISTVALPTGTVLKTITEMSAKTYTVKQGDSLWTIAESVYNSGYRWVDIARANNLGNPNEIEEGMILKLPKVTLTPTSTLTPTPQIQIGQAIKESFYTVKKGDSLWNIALRSYADGYRWVDIARANNLENPDLIFSGNTLKIPR